MRCHGDYIFPDDGKFVCSNDELLSEKRHEDCGRVRLFLDHDSLSRKARMRTEDTRPLFSLSLGSQNLRQIENDKGRIIFLRNTTLCPTSNLSVSRFALQRMGS
jgi:hypothetical protein